MKRLCILMSILLIMPLFSSCSDLQEPNELAYVVAIGVDKTENFSEDNKSYDITIQFAKPVQISGGEEGGKGEDIMENITLTSPTLLSAFNMANQIVSKKFELSHTKLIVFSEDIAKEGIKNFMQVMSRNSELRPNIYLAVSSCKAQKYLESVKPMVEINPVKYYQHIYENYNSLYVPNNLSQDFYFSESSPYVDSVLPLAGVLPEKKDSDTGQSSDDSSGSSDSGSSGGTDENSSGDSSSNGDTKKTYGSDANSDSNSQNSNNQKGDTKSQQNTQSDIKKRTDSEFEYSTPNYLPSEMPQKTKNPSEVIGMALFSGDKMIGKMGAVDCELYNILMGKFSLTNVPFKIPSNNSPITISIQQNAKPNVKIDTTSDSPIITIKLDLDGEILSVPAEYIEAEQIDEIEQTVITATKSSLEHFLYKTSTVYNTDICAYGGYAKRSFLTNDDFNSYNWKEKYKNSVFNIEIKFKIRRSGLIFRGNSNKI